MNTQLSRKHLIAHSVLTVVGTTGIAALFLPFAYGYSPVEAAFEKGLWQVAVPFFLSPFAFAGSLRWMVSGAFSRLERAIAYVLSTASAAVTFSLYFGIDEWPSGVHEWLSCAMPLLTLFVGVYLLLRNSRTGLPKVFNAVMAIHVAYLANGVLCLVGLFGEWQVGAYFTLVAASTFIFQMSLVSAQPSGRPV